MSDELLEKIVAIVRATNRRIFDDDSDDNGRESERIAAEGFDQIANHVARHVDVRAGQ